MSEAIEAGAIGEEGQRQLKKIFVMVDRWRKRTHAQPTPPVVGSSLRKDDETTAPYHLSGAVGGALLSAVDHLDAFRALVVDAQILHARAPYTLLRAALENAATAVWLLAPRSRDERVLRLLRLQWADSRESENAQRLFGAEPKLSRAEWTAKLERVATTRGLSPQQVADVTGKWPGWKEIVDKAGTEGRELSGRDSVFLWMLASGIAHGHLWAVLSPLLERVETVASGDLVTLRLSASDKAVVLMASVATLMMFEGFRLVDERSQNHLA